MAGRASVEFYVGLALKARGAKSVVREEAFVIRAFRNGLGVFISKYVWLSGERKNLGLTIPPIGSESRALSCLKENQNTMRKTTR